MVELPPDLFRSPTWGQVEVVTFIWWLHNEERLEIQHDLTMNWILGWMKWMSVKIDMTNRKL